MQIESSTLRLSTAASLSSSKLQKQAAAQDRPARSTAAFPEAPLISSQPLRYNVRLNQQLTSVQQAESYLQATEQQVLALSHSITRRSGATEVTRKAEQLQQLLADRPALSGGTVNRQLQVSLAGKSQVTFNLRDGEALLQPAAAELLTFSLAGDKREISAAALPANGSPQETLLAINQALGKWGIHGRLNAQRQPGFEVDEQQWSRVSQHLSVQGGGTRYPHGQFVPLRLQAEPALEQEIAALIDKPARPERLLPALEEALNTLTQQRRELQRCRGAVAQRIDSMATFANSGSALASAQQLAERLQQGSFQDVAQALGAQANVPPPRVRNVLS